MQRTPMVITLLKHNNHYIAQCSQHMLFVRCEKSKQLVVRTQNIRFQWLVNICSKWLKQLGEWWTMLIGLSLILSIIHSSSMTLKGLQRCFQQPPGMVKDFLVSVQNPKGCENKHEGFIDRWKTLQGIGMISQSRRKAS